VANVTFSGSVSAQAASGETVTIIVTMPDTTKDTLTAITLADKSYTVTKQYSIAGSYSAQASGVADAMYSSWQSPVVPYTISLSTRTGTLVVTLAA
jgi:hypothetical protein